MVTTAAERRVDGGRHRGRGAAAGVLLDQGVRPALQRQVPRRQVLPVAGGDPRRGVPPGAWSGAAPRSKGVRYFGPYSHAWAIRETVDLLLRVFPMRSCSNGVFKRSAQIGRPCLLGYIGKCSAPCVGRVTRRGAPGDRRRLLRLHGRADQRRSSSALEKQMYAASDDLDFERAARLRDDLGALQPGPGEAGRRARRRHRRRRGRVLRGPARGGRADLRRARRPGPRPARLGGRQGRRRRHRRPGASASCSSSTTTRSATRSRARCWCPHCPTTTPRSSEWLSDAARRPGALRVPQRGDKKALQETVARNALQALGLHKTKRASDLTTRNRALEEIQQALGAAGAPLRIECYDISNLQGTEVVGVDGGVRGRAGPQERVPPLRGRGVEGQNDVASMHEVITRRFRRLLDERAESGTPGDGQDGPDDAADEGPMLIDPETGRPAQVRLRARAGRRRRRAAAGRRGAAGARRARHRRRARCAGWPSAWRRCGCPARRTR